MKLTIASSIPSVATQKCDISSNLLEHKTLLCITLGY